MQPVVVPISSRPAVEVLTIFSAEPNEDVGEGSGSFRVTLYLGQKANVLIKAIIHIPAKNESEALCVIPWFSYNNCLQTKRFTSMIINSFVVCLICRRFCTDHTLISFI